MPNLTTIARPYAKAILALAQADNSYAQWSRMLEFLANVVKDPVAKQFLQNVAVPTEAKAKFICELAPQQLNTQGQNLVQILAQAKRLLILPGLHDLYEELRRDVQKEVLMHVSVARATPEDALQGLVDRLRGEVNLTTNVNEKLLGGGTVQIGNHIIDGSMQGRLKALREFMST